MKKKPQLLAINADKADHLTAKGKISTLLRGHISTAANGTRRLSSETVEIRMNTLFMVVDQLKEGGFAITDIGRLQQKHLYYLARRWEAEGLSAGTLQNRWSILKTLLEKWYGRKGSINKLSTYLLDPSRADRTYIATEDKSWSAKVDYEMIFKMVYAKDRYVGDQLRMMLLFGLRKKEAIMFQPLLCDLGDIISITTGTKGGRHRWVEVTTPEQRQFLDELRSRCRNRSEHLGNPSRTLEQNLARFENVLAALKITKKGMGISSHGLRHQFANDLIEKMTGQPTPVRAGGVPIDRERFEEAREHATRALGHGRTSITSAYHGSVRKPRQTESDGY